METAREREGRYPELLGKGLKGGEGVRILARVPKLKILGISLTTGLLQDWKAGKMETNGLACPPLLKCIRRPRSGRYQTDRGNNV